VQCGFGSLIEHSSIRIALGLGKRVFIPCFVKFAMPFGQSLDRDGSIG
jgi:hypothetical protein